MLTCWKYSGRYGKDRPTEVALQLHRDRSEISNLKTNFIYFMMRKQLFPFAAILLASCTQSGLFEADQDSAQRAPVWGPSGRPAITLQVHESGGQHFEMLQIDDNGYVAYANTQLNGGTLTAALPSDELNALINFFLRNDFFHLTDVLVLDEQTANEVHVIEFWHGSQTHRVTTQSLSQSPEPLREIIAQLQQTTAKLSAQGLRLSLEASRTRLIAGETLTLTLNVANPSSYPIELVASGQVFDFFAVPAASWVSEPQRTIQLPLPVWNWAHERFFAQVISRQSIAPGESLRYEVPWDGRDNSGELLEGDFWIIAKMVTMPGGYTAPVALHITK